MPLVPKHVVLQTFTAIIHKHDPMESHSRDAEEYEPEALSILSRFSEASLHMLGSEKEIVELSLVIVVQAFEFWFGANQANLEPLASELLKAYLDSFPSEAPEPVSDEQGLT